MNIQKTTSIENLMPVFRERLEAGQMVRFSPQGTSMLPMLRQDVDSVVIAPPAGKLKKYDIPLYQRADGQYVLHRIVAVEAAAPSEQVTACDKAACDDQVAQRTTYTCMGDNQFVKEYGVEHSQIIGYVTEFYRGGSRHTIDGTGYRIYCRVWYHSRHFRHFWKRVKRKLRSMIK